jgi:hypothetical protein
MSDETFETGDLKITVRDDNDTVSVSWLGTSDAREPGRELTPFLSGLAPKLVGKSVDVDFRKLEYMNSGTVSPIIQFARALDQHGVKSRLLFDSQVGWQRVNYVCLKNIAKSLPHIEVEG